MCHALSLCRANKAKTKRCLSIKWQIQTKANQNQTKPKRTKPNPFAHSVSMRINGSGAAADPRATLECPELLGLPSDKLFKSFSLFPIDDPINGFSKFIYCQLWKWKLSHTHIHLYIYISFNPPTNHSWKKCGKNFCTSTTQSSTWRTCFTKYFYLEIALFFPFLDSPVHFCTFPKDLHQWIGCQGNTFVFIKDTNYCNKLKYCGDKLKCSMSY